MLLCVVITYTHVYHVIPWPTLHTQLHFSHAEQKYPNNAGAELMHVPYASLNPCPHPLKTNYKNFSRMHYFLPARSLIRTQIITHMVVSDITERCEQVDSPREHCNIPQPHLHSLNMKESVSCSHLYTHYDTYFTHTHTHSLYHFAYAQTHTHTCTNTGDQRAVMNLSSLLIKSFSTTMSAGKSCRKPEMTALRFQ